MQESVENRLNRIEETVEQLILKIESNFEEDKKLIARIEKLSRRTAISVDKQTIVLLVVSGLLIFLFVQGAITGTVNSSLVETLIPVLIALSGSVALLPKKE